MKKIINVAVNIIFVLLILSSVALVLLRAVGITAYAVKTPSMYPVCPVGTMIFVVPTAFDDFSEGDIVTYKVNSTVVTHRIYDIDTENRTVITKGDNNNTPDGSPISEKNIVGKVEFYIPYAGYVYIFAETTYGKVSLVAAFVVLAALSVLTRSSDDETKQNEKSED